MSMGTLPLPERLRKCVELVLRFWGHRVSVEWSEDPFELLVETILSQNTSSENAERAVESLRRLCGGVLTPERILEHSTEEVAESIRIAGMQWRRAVVLRRLCSVLLTQGLDLRRLSDLPTPELRRRLLELPGVGEKTADILLLFHYRRPVMPVDTHITRIVSRWVGRRLRYSEVQDLLHRVLPPDPELYARTHLALIQFGREVCRARSPQCSQCPLSIYGLCPSRCGGGVAGHGGGAPERS